VISMPVPYEGRSFADNSRVTGVASVQQTLANNGMAAIPTLLQGFDDERCQRQ
jgi:hypothetical protein